MTLKIDLPLDPAYCPSPEVAAILERLQGSFVAVESLIEGAVPDRWEKARALTALQEASMWVRQALRAHEKAGNSLGPLPNDNG